jgi:hypothetical protein
MLFPDSLSVFFLWVDGAVRLSAFSPEPALLAIRSLGVSAFSPGPTLLAIHSLGVRVSIGRVLLYFNITPSLTIALSLI